MNQAQAVLAFNLDPKEGVKYLEGKLGKSTANEVGQWLAQMSTVNGGACWRETFLLTSATRCGSIWFCGISTSRWSEVPSQRVKRYGPFVKAELPSCYIAAGASL
ncbi:Cyth4, partial [Symbiodinium sp. CCMP2456]